MAEMVTGTSFEEQREFYNRAYLRSNYFDYTQRLYRPFIRSLVAVSGLKKGSRVLDAGCGQGFFSYLLATEGMAVYSTDISMVGLGVAKRTFGHACDRFFVSDLNCLAFARQFDGVFIRSCSLFNTTDLQQGTALVTALQKIIRPGGVLMFVYNTNLSGRSGGWTHHRLADIRACFAASRGEVTLYFVNKLDVFVLRALAFNPAVTMVNEFLAGRTGLGAEAVVLSRVNGQ